MASVNACLRRSVSTANTDMTDKYRSGMSMT